MFALFDASWIADRLIDLNAQGINLLEYVLYERITSVTDPRLLHHEERQVLAETVAIMKGRLETAVIDEPEKGEAARPAPGNRQLGCPPGVGPPRGAALRRRLRRGPPRAPRPDPRVSKNQ